MSDEQLGLTLKEANENLFRLRIKQQTERLDAPSELRRNRRLDGPDQNSPNAACKESRSRQATVEAESSNSACPNDNSSA